MYPFKTVTLLTTLLLGMATATVLRAEMSLYIVAPGDTLWSIASENLKSPHDWRRLMEFNNMTEQSQLKVDQELRIPMEWLNSSFAPLAAANRPANLPPVALAPARLEKAHAPTATPAAREGAKSVKGVAAVSSSAHAVAATYGLVEQLNGALRTNLAPNDTLLEQSRVSTGKQSAVNIRLRDGSMVVLLSESEVELSQPLKLVRGALEYTAHNGAERALVSAAAGEIKGQQAHFRVTSLKDGRQLQVEVERGMISVAANGEQRAMSAGLAMLVESGQPLNGLHQGVMRPDVSNLSKGGVNGQINLSWPPLSDASGYRAQLTYASDAYLVLLDEKVSQPRLAWNNISPGLYKIRLRSVDHRGLEGLNAEFPFVVQGALAAPRSNSPLDGATLPTNTPWIAWSRVEEANSYTLQVARDATFKTGLQEYSYLVNSYYKYGDGLPAGDYYWRVMSISRKQEKSGFGDVRIFRIK